MDRLARLITALLLPLVLLMPGKASAVVNKVWWTNNNSCLYEGPPSALPQSTIACLYQAGGGNPSGVKNCYFESFAGTSQTQIQIRCTVISSGASTMWYVYGSLKCPTNSTGTTTCTCSSGFSETNGACYTACPVAGSQIAPAGTLYQAGNGLTSTVCLASCEASAFMAAKQDGKNYVWGPIVSTGRNCAAVNPSPSSATDTNPKCPVGKCPGTINGQSICVPCAETKQDTKASSSETAASAASGAAPGPGQTTTQSGSSSTTCAGDTCTTTGQQTVQNPDGSTETKTTTTTQSKGDYCKENPKAGACVGSESTWGGTCQAFTCDGDAVQCAQARGAWELACQLKTEATDPTVQAGTDAIAQTGEASIKDQLGMNTSQVFDLASRLDSTSLFGTPGACPSDTVLPLGIGSVTLPFASMCPQLNLVGVAMMGLAYLIAAFIVFRPGKGA